MRLLEKVKTWTAEKHAIFIPAARQGNPEKSDTVTKACVKACEAVAERWGCCLVSSSAQYPATGTADRALTGPRSCPMRQLGPH